MVKRVRFKAWSNEKGEDIVEEKRKTQIEIVNEEETQYNRQSQLLSSETRGKKKHVRIRPHAVR